MSFGASKPIAVRLIGTDYDEVRKHAEKIAGELKHIPFLRDVGFEQTLDYPTVEVEIDRELAGLIGVTPEHVKRALVMATSSTRFTNLNYWINVKTGFDYLVQIQVPPLRMDKPEDLEELPLESVNPDVPLMVRDVLKDGQVHTSVRPGEYDRDMSQRLPDRGRQRRGRGHGPSREPGPPGGQGRRRRRPAACTWRRWASSRR